MNEEIRQAYLILNKAIHKKKLPPKKQVKQFIESTYWKAHYIRKLQDIGVYLNVVK